MSGLHQLLSVSSGITWTQPIKATIRNSVKQQEDSSIVLPKVDSACLLKAMAHVIQTSQNCLCWVLLIIFFSLEPKGYSIFPQVTRLYSLFEFFFRSDFPFSLGDKWVSDLEQCPLNCFLLPYFSRTHILYLEPQFLKFIICCDPCYEADSLIQRQSGQLSCLIAVILIPDILGLVLVTSLQDN